MNIVDALTQLELFKGDSLATTLDRLAESVANQPISSLERINKSYYIDANLLTSALAVKQMSAQIDVIVHAACIAYVLPYILHPDELIQSVALGANNADSEFDLVTNHRIAEFKFVMWKPKGNAVREKTLFGDFVKLAREDTTKKKYLYVLNTDIPRRFLSGKRDILKILDYNVRLRNLFFEQYGDKYIRVGTYYEAHKDRVQVVNLADEVKGIAQIITTIYKVIHPSRAEE